MSKFFLKSKTVLGVLISIAPTVLPLVGIDFNPDDATMFTSTADLVIQAVGAVLALYGRVKAKVALALGTGE